MKRKLGILFWQAKISLAKKLFTRNDTTGNMFFDHELRREVLKVTMFFLFKNILASKVKNIKGN